LGEAARSIREDSVSTLRGAPAELTEIIRRCLAKEADKRYPSATELANALSELPVGEALEPETQPDDDAT
jgi:hypothetical protein